MKVDFFSVRSRRLTVIIIAAVCFVLLAVCALGIARWYSDTSGERPTQGTSAAAVTEPPVGGDNIGYDVFE